MIKNDEEIINITFHGKKDDLAKMKEEILMDYIQYKSLLNKETGELLYSFINAYNNKLIDLKGNDNGN